jgi:anti-sigma factor ChrR (cupin superfamily)
MDTRVPEELHQDPSEPVIVDATSLPWTPSPAPGVVRRFLERKGGEIARATSIVRYAPGSSFPGHVHDKGEEYLVLDGVFSDEQGDFARGTYVRNPPGSRHAPFTRDGCTIFVKLRQMVDEERDALVVRTDEQAPCPTAVDGLARIPLFDDDVERVALEILEPGAEWRDRGEPGGEEILVLAGTLLYGERECGPYTWIRMPRGREATIASSGGCRLWTKRGHLRPTNPSGERTSRIRCRD